MTKDEEKILRVLLERLDRKQLIELVLYAFKLRGKGKRQNDQDS